MIAEGRVAPDQVDYNDLPWKYSAGTPNILGVTGPPSAPVRRRCGRRGWPSGLFPQHHPDPACRSGGHDGRDRRTHPPPHGPGTESVGDGARGDDLRTTGAGAAVPAGRLQRNRMESDERRRSPERGRCGIPRRVPLCDPGASRPGSGTGGQLPAQFLPLQHRGRGRAGGRRAPAHRVTRPDRQFPGTTWREASPGLTECPAGLAHETHRRAAARDSGANAAGIRFDDGVLRAMSFHLGLGPHR